MSEKAKNIDSFSVLDIPKVTLHEHIEGTVTPRMTKHLAKRHGVELPDDLIMKEGTYDKTDFPDGRYDYEEGDFMGFITTYDHVANLVRTPEDYYDVTKDYLSKNAEEGGIYAELIISPVHMAAEVDKKTGKVSLSTDKYKKMFAGIEKAVKEVKEKTGLETRFIATGVRNMGVESVKEVAELIRDNPHPLVTGFGLAGNEKELEVKDFEEGLVKIAHEQAGLPLALHAGEIRGPESMWDALEAGATRIGHGISAVKDDKLMKELASKNITLELCPTSNRLLVQELKSSLKEHPLRKLYDAGVRITINPDDAGVFGTHTGKEHKIAQENFGLNRTEMLDIAVCGIEAAFVDDATKKKLKEDIYKRMDSKDRSDFKDLASKTKNPFLKKRLEIRFNESEKVAKEMQILKNKEKTLHDLTDSKTTAKAIISKKLQNGR